MCVSISLFFRKISQKQNVQSGIKGGSCYSINYKDIKRQMSLDQKNPTANRKPKLYRGLFYDIPFLFLLPEKFLFNDYILYCIIIFILCKKNQKNIAFSTFITLGKI